MDNLAGSIGLLLYQSICHHERIEEIAKNKISPMNCFHILLNRVSYLTCNDSYNVLQPEVQKYTYYCS